MSLGGKQTSTIYVLCIWLKKKSQISMCLWKIYIWELWMVSLPKHLYVWLWFCHLNSGHSGPDQQTPPDLSLGRFEEILPQLQLSTPGVSSVLSDGPPVKYFVSQVIPCHQGYFELKKQTKKKSKSQQDDHQLLFLIFVLHILVMSFSFLNIYSYFLDSFSFPIFLFNLLFYYLENIIERFDILLATNCSV